MWGGGGGNGGCEPVNPDWLIISPYSESFNVQDPEK